MANTSSKKPSLVNIIENRLIPWTQQAITSHIAIAPLQENNLPFGVTFSKSTFKGPRVPIRNLRKAGHMSVNTAKWPNDGLCEKNEPFLMCVVAGKATIQIGSQLLTCNEGSFVFIPPGVAHPAGTKPYTQDRELCSILWTRRCGAGLRCWISHSQNAKNIKPYHAESVYFPQEQIVQTFETLCQELLGRRKNDTCHHALMLFLLLMRRELVTGHAFDISTAKGQPHEYEEQIHSKNDPLQLAENYIQSHLADPITIEIVARHIHLSRASFAKLFRQHTGRTFLQYVHHRRLNQAQTFLQETTWTVRSIAELCGFASESGFNRFFVKQQGITPLAYRNKQQSR
jgi:AraC-like DNA-binding protein